MAGPNSASSGTRSIPWEPSTKWFGGSTWVPVCVPIRISETLAGSPRASRSRGAISTGGSPGHTSRSPLMVSEMSISRLIARWPGAQADSASSAGPVHPWSSSWACSLSVTRTAITLDQRVGRGVVLQIGLLLGHQFRLDPRGQDLAQLHAPLVERIDVPDRPLGEHLVLVQRDQLA